jgi:serine/threonine-protein kinase HipA
MSELIVYLAGTPTGRLIRKPNGNLQFRYDEGYAGPPISQALPIQKEAHPHALCHAVFGGLLLEGDPREALAKNLGVSVGNDYALLEELGADCAGALTLLATGEAPPTDPKLRHITAEDLDRHLRELPQRPLAADPNDGIRLSLAGAQPKLAVILDGGSVALPQNTAAPTTHILKPEPPRFPGLVENEAFCMSLADDVGLSAAKVAKRRSVSGIPYLEVERYDRDVTADPIRRLHQEDVCQALGRPSEAKYQAEGGPSVVETVELLRRCSAVPAQDLPRFWKALVFNWLIGNCDAHAKNYSLLYDTGAPTLAPLYDLVCTTVYPELTTRLAMTIGGARDIRDVDPRAWEGLGQAAGMSSRFARNATADTVREVAARVRDRATSDERGTITSAIVNGVLARAEPWG